MKNEWELGKAGRCPECRGGAFHKMDCSRRNELLPREPPPKARRTDHCVIDTSTGEYVFRCLHCGGEYTPALPIPVRLMSALCKAWAADHRRCRKRPEGGAASVYVRPPEAKP